MEAKNAHISSITTSKMWAYDLYKHMSTLYKEHFTCSVPLGLPFKPLYGISAPALAIETSIESPQDWNRYIQPISEALSTILDQRQKKRKSRAWLS